MGKGEGKPTWSLGSLGLRALQWSGRGGQRYSNLVGRLLGHAVSTVMSALGPVFGPKTSTTRKTRRINQGKLAHLFWELGAKWAAGSTCPLSLSLSTPRSTFGWPAPPIQNIFSLGSSHAPRLFFFHCSPSPPRYHPLPGTLAHPEIQVPFSCLSRLTPSQR